MDTSLLAYLCMIAASSIFCWRLIYVELRKRAKDKKEKTLNRNQIWLNRWSILSMISSTLCLQIHCFESFQSICKYADIISLILFISGKCFTTLHRIARLQYYFRADRVHSKRKDGFTKRLFITEKCTGLLLFLLILYTSLDLLLFAEWEYIDSYNGCYAKDTDHFHDIFRRNYLYPFAVINYVIWDWTVLIKIMKFYILRKKQNMDIDESISIKLYKIAFLTLIMELTSVIACIGTNLLIRDVTNWNLMIIVTIFTIMDITVSTYMVFLMMDHNHDEYVKFMEVLNKAGIFCCCNGFVQIALASILIMKQMCDQFNNSSSWRVKNE